MIYITLAAPLFILAIVALIIRRARANRRPIRSIEERRFELGIVDRIYPSPHSDAEQVQP